MARRLKSPRKFRGSTGQLNESYDGDNDSILSAPVTAEEFAQIEERDKVMERAEGRSSFLTVLCQGHGWWNVINATCNISGHIVADSQTLFKLPVKRAQ